MNPLTSILWVLHLCAFLSSSVCCLEFPCIIFQTLQRHTESSEERCYSSYTCLPSHLLTICFFSSYLVLTYFSICFHCFWGSYVSSPLSYLHLTRVLALPPADHLFIWKLTVCCVGALQHQLSLSLKSHLQLQWALMLTNLWSYLYACC